MQLRLVSNKHLLRVQELAMTMATAIINCHKLRTDNYTLVFNRAPIRCDTINVEVGSVYIRHLFFDKLALPRVWKTGMVLANISIYDGYKGKGIFSAMINIIRKEDQPIIIENVIEPRFRRRLHYLGFRLLDPDYELSSLSLPSYITRPGERETDSPFFAIHGKHYFWTKSASIRGPFPSADRAYSAYQSAAYLGEC